jgi:hypothetical protein
MALGCHDEEGVMNTWTTEETITLVRLWPTHSASQIARQLQRPRSAIAGKAKRLRAEGRLPRNVVKHFEINPVTPPRRGRPPEQLMVAAANSLSTQNFTETATLTGSLAMQPCSILELEAGRCHWPLGEVSEVATMFCGGVAMPKRRYCAHHLWVACNHD